MTGAARARTWRSPTRARCTRVRVLRPLVRVLRTLLSSTISITWRTSDSLGSRPESSARIRPVGSGTPRGREWVAAPWCDRCAHGSGEAPSAAEVTPRPQHHAPRSSLPSMVPLPSVSTTAHTRLISVSSSGPSALPLPLLLSAAIVTSRHAFTTPAPRPPTTPGLVARTAGVTTLVATLLCACECCCRLIVCRHRGRAAVCVVCRVACGSAQSSHTQAKCTFASCSQRTLGCTHTLLQRCRRSQAFTTPSSPARTPARLRTGPPRASCWS